MSKSYCPSCGVLVIGNLVAHKPWCSPKTTYMGYCAACGASLRGADAEHEDDCPMWKEMDVLHSTDAKPNVTEAE